jgi:hypothetical protein
MKNLVWIASSIYSEKTPRSHSHSYGIMGEVKRHSVQQDDQTLPLLRVGA